MGDNVAGLKSRATFNQVVEHLIALDRTYGALAHSTRRALLDMLKHGSTRVTDVAEPFPISLAAVSKHIGVLERAGLVTRTVSGRDHVLALEAHPMLDARLWIDTYQGFWEERLDALEAHLRAT
jgi:DNA-binding transcriptional ArsR family regulator